MYWSMTILKKSIKYLNMLKCWINRLKHYLAFLRNIATKNTHLYQWTDSFRSKTFTVVLRLNIWRNSLQCRYNEFRSFFKILQEQVRKKPNWVQKKRPYPKLNRNNIQALRNNLHVINHSFKINLYRSVIHWIKR